LPQFAWNTSRTMIICYSFWQVLPAMFWFAAEDRGPLADSLNTTIVY